MASKPKPKPRRRGFDTGGLYGGPGISSHSMGDSITSGFNSATSMYSMLDKMKDSDKPKPPDPGKPPEDPPGTLGGQGLYARGGKIKKTAGPRIGKDDGLIPAQRGEYVVRKSAVKKLGTKVLNQVNKGKLPASRGR